MNKGIRAATGDVVAILNADDVYASTDVLARVAHAFTATGTDAVYGDLNYVAADNLLRVTRRWRSGAYSPGAFRRGWMPPHRRCSCAALATHAGACSTSPFVPQPITSSCFGSSTGMA